MAFVVDGTGVKLYDMVDQPKSIELKKKGDSIIALEDNVIRQEHFLNFVRPDVVCVVSLWEEDITEDHSESADEIKGRRFILFMDKNRLKKQSDSIIDFSDSEHIPSLDEMKVFMLNGREGAKEILNIFFSSPSASSFEKIAMPDKKATFEENSFDNDKTIE